MYLYIHLKGKSTLAILFLVLFLFCFVYSFSYISQEGKHVCFAVNIEYMNSKDTLWCFYVVSGHSGWMFSFKPDRVAWICALPWRAPWRRSVACGSAAACRRGLSGRSAERLWAGKQANICRIIIHISAGGNVLVREVIDRFPVLQILIKRLYFSHASPYGGEYMCRVVLPWNPLNNQNNAFYL